MKKQNGSLLIILLWIIAILAVVGITLGYRVALDIHLTKASSALIKGSYLSRAAIAKAITVLKKDTTLNYDTLVDTWADNTGEFKETLIGLFSFSIFYDDKGEKKYGIIDAERKINLNTAPAEVLENLFTSLNIDTDLIPYLLDWIDEDDDDRNHGRGAENDYYENIQPSYTTKNAPIETFEEILLIKEFDSETLKKLLPHITLYGSGQINLNTADPLTFEALGFSQSFIDKIARFRQGDDGIVGTEDDGIVASFEEFLSSVDKFEGLEGNEKTLLNKFKNYFRPTSTAFHLQAHIQSSLHVEKELFAVLRIEKGKDVEVIYSYEN